MICHLALLALLLPLKAQSVPHDWRAKCARYVAGMAQIERDLKAWREETAALRQAYTAESAPQERAKLSAQLATSFLGKYNVDEQLRTLDQDNRLHVMTNFVAYVQGRLGSDSLRYTGGTAPGPEFRPGYGDFDLETPAEQADQIRDMLRAFAEDLHEQEDYLASESLRLTIFRRRALRSEADFERHRAALERAAQDREIYLHIRVRAPPEQGKGGAAGQAYATAVRALEIQGHIKKGLAGVHLQPPAALLELQNLDNLQFLAKAVLKALRAAGLDGAAGKAAIIQAAQEAGLARPDWLPQWLDKLRGSWYYNPYGLGLDEGNVAQFQQAAQSLLRRAAVRADELAEEAFDVHLQLLANRMESEWKEPLALALQLYELQARGNFGAAPGLPAGDQADEILAAFRLPEAFTVQPDNQGLYIQGAGRAVAPATLLPQRTLAANWQPDTTTKRSWADSSQSDTRFSIRVAVAQYATDTEAKYAYQHGYRPEYLAAEQAAAKAQPQSAVGSLETHFRTDTNYLVYPFKPGKHEPRAERAPNAPISGVTIYPRRSETERLGTARREITTEPVGPNGIWVEYRHLIPIIRETTDLIAADLVDTSKEHLEALENKRQAVALGQRSKPEVSALYRTRWQTVQTLTSEGLSIWQAQGLGRLGRCLIYVSLEASYGRESTEDDANQKRIMVDTTSPPYWTEIADTFRRLMRRPAKQVVAARIRLAGLDSEFKGVAADGVSTLELAADIIGDEDALNGIAAVQWEVRDVPDSCPAGKVQSPNELVFSGPNRRTVTGTYRPPADVPNEHTQNICLALTLKDGTRYTSPAVPLLIIPPPLILIHGLWSDYQAMLPLRHFLVAGGAASQQRCLSVDYGGRPMGNLHALARPIRAELLALIEARQTIERIKTARVNIVAHSLGGILARIIILGHGGDATLPGDGDKVLKLITLATPHQGSHLADWYADWNPALFTDQTDPSQNDFDNLRTHLRLLANLRNREDILAFGPAVLALRTTRMTFKIKPHKVDNIFLDNLYQAQRDRAPAHLQVYCVAGTEPFLPRKYAELVATLIYNGIQGLNLLPQWQADGSIDVGALDFAGAVSKTAGWKIALAQYALEGLKSQRFKQMVTEACYMISHPATDGVVQNMSAIPSQFGAQLAGKLEVPTHHFGVPSHPMVLARVQEWLTGNTAPPSRWTTVGARSPGRLHLYDVEGRHVGQTATHGLEQGIPGAVHVEYSDAMGAHEWVLLPSNEDVRVEFETTESERVTLNSAHGHEGAVTAHEFRDIWVAPSEHLRYATAQPVTSAQHVAADGTITPLTPVLLRLESGKDQPENVAASAIEPPPRRQNRPPQAAFTVQPTAPKPGEPMVVTATIQDPDGDRLTWRWHLNGQHLEQHDQVAEWEWPGLPAGPYVLKLSVRDARGQLTLVEQELVVAGEHPDAPALPATVPEAYQYSLECHQRLQAVMADDPRGVSPAAQDARRQYDQALRHYQQLLQAGP